MVDTGTRVAAEYNHEHFALENSIGGPDFKQINPVGTVAPDFRAVRLRDRADVKLSDYLGKGFVVLEFGSVT